MKRLTPPIIVSMIALFVALGGAAVAGTGLITGSQIANHTIPATKLTPSAVAALRGKTGPPGASTPQEIKFDQYVGPQASQCAVGGGACQVAGSTATCQNGVAISGGYHAGTADDVVASAHVTGTTGYSVIATNYQDSPSTIQAYVVCAEGGTYNSIVVQP